MLSAFIVLTGCASGTMLSTQALQEGHAPSDGTYTLILYGGQNVYDYETIAILDRSDDPYTILPFGAPFHYRVIREVSAADALRQGDSLMNDLNGYQAMERRGISGPDKTLIGYELRPLFAPLFTGRHSDALTTSYLLGADNSITVYVSLKDSVMDSRHREDGDSSNAE